LGANDTVLVQARSKLTWLLFTSKEIRGSLMATHLRTAFILFFVLQIAAGCAATRKGSTPQILQPDYQKWSQVHEGMTQKDVDAILGKPLSGDPDCAGGASEYVAVYGVLRFDAARFPGPYEFSIGYNCKDHTVTWKDDPFGGKFSSDGKPTRPLLIYPVNGQEFGHYPRFVDFRWTPSSGVYPMRYEVQFNLDPTVGVGPADAFTYKTDDPLLVESWVGAQTGTWRVRAINRLGTSAWSEQRTFSFSR
jgi:hypothetical protein